MSERVNETVVRCNQAAEKLGQELAALRFALLADPDLSLGTKADVRIGSIMDQIASFPQRMEALIEIWKQDRNAP